jgi:NosR/NirI family nitrous oxide reductase transcriptional regulator
MSVDFCAMKHRFTLSPSPVNLAAKKTEFKNTAISTLRHCYYYFFSFLILIVLLMASAISLADNAPVLPRLLNDLTPQAVLSGSDQLEEIPGSPPVAPVFKGSEQVGYVFVNSDYVNSTG